MGWLEAIGSRDRTINKQKDKQELSILSVENDGDYYPPNYSMTLTVAAAGHQRKESCSWFGGLCCKTSLDPSIKKLHKAIIVGLHISVLT